MPPQIPRMDRGEFGPPASRLRLAAGVAVLILFFLLIGTTYYTVNPEELGVVLRFGKYRAQASPGLHFKLPFGIDTVIKVPVLRQMKQEFGFRTVEAGITSHFKGTKEDTSLLDEALMVTGDLNMTVVEWIIQYHIKDPQKYLFQMREPDKTLRDATESMMREVIGDRTVDEALTFGRSEIADTARTGLQALVEKYQMGITIDQLLLQDVAPPASVEASFNEVSQAQQEREKMIYEARSEYNKVVPKAAGEAAQKIQEAQGYATKRVNEAMGDAARFQATLAAYLKAPEVTRQRIYLETMAKIIPQVGRKLVIDRDVQQLLPLLSMDTTPEVKK